MKKNLELILLIINWVIVAIQAFTIFLYGNSIGLFIIMLLALIAQVFSVYVKLDIENPIIRINTAFKGCSSLEKISVLPRIYHN